MKKVNWTNLKNFINNKSLAPQYLEFQNYYHVVALDGVFELFCEIPKISPTPSGSDQEDFENNFKSNSNKKLDIGQEPFASKTLRNGKKLFKRIHGVQHTLTTANNKIDFIVPYTQAKITGLEIIGANIGDVADFSVYDNSVGTISGIPNFKLNQFGFAVNMSKDFHKEVSQYDADLIQGMKLEVDYTGTVNQLVCVNFILHEIK